MESNVSTFEFANGRKITAVADPRTGRIRYETVVEQPHFRLNMEAQGSFPEQRVIDAIAKAAHLTPLEQPVVPTAVPDSVA